MPSINGYNFTAWQGRMIPADQQVGLVESAPSVDGYGLAIGAWRADAVNITTITYVGNVSSAENLRETFRALSAQTVEVVDQFNVIWSSVVVMRAQSTYSYSLFNNLRFVTDWRLLVTSDPPAGAIS